MTERDRLTLTELLGLAHKALDEAGVVHALIGGLGLGAHGVHRATRDVDLLASGTERELLVDALTRFGFELLEQTAEVLHFGGPGEVDILLANRPPTLAMVRNAKPAGTIRIPCVSAEDLIGLKIQAYVNDARRSLSDQADIAALMVANSDLNWIQIKAYADVFGEWPTIESIKARHVV